MRFVSSISRRIKLSCLPWVKIINSCDPIYMHQSVKFLRLYSNPNEPNSSRCKLTLRWSMHWHKHRWKFSLVTTPFTLSGIIAFFIWHCEVARQRQVNGHNVYCGSLKHTNVGVHADCISYRPRAYFNHLGEVTKVCPKGLIRVGYSCVSHGQV